MNITMVRRYDLHYTKAILDFQDEKKKKKTSRVLQSGFRLFLPIEAGGVFKQCLLVGRHVELA